MRSRKARSSIAVLLFAAGSLGNTCVVDDEDQDETAWRNQSTEEQMEDEEVDELDRENDF